MASILPILLLGGAALVLSSGRKKRKVAAVRKIGAEGYSYTSDCKRLWIGEVEVTRPDVTVDLTQNQNIDTFISGQVVPAVTRALEQVDLDAPGIPLIEAATYAAATMAPECQLRAGKPAPPVASGLLSVSLSVMPQVAIQLGLDLDDILRELIRETFILAKAPGASAQKVDLINLIQNEKANPSEVTIPDGFVPDLPTLPTGPIG